MNEREFVNKKLGDNTHGEFSISRTQLEDWIIEFHEKELKRLDLQINFERDLFKLINEYSYKGLSKTDLMSKLDGMGLWAVVR
jgi:hypothetical protein